VRLPRSSPRDPLRGRAVASGLDSLMAPGLFPRDEHRQVERVDQAELGQFPGCAESSDHVAALQCPLEDRMRPALRSRRSSSLGAGTAA
jgi:hypothetical protein